MEMNFSYAKPVIYSILGTGIGIALGLAFNPAVKCDNASPVYSITCIALGAIGFFAHLLNIRLHSAINIANLPEVILRSNDTIIQRMWYRIYPGACGITGICFGSGIGIIFIPTFICASSSAAFSFVELAFCAGTIGLNFADACSTLEVYRSMQNTDTESVGDVETPTPQITQVVPIG